LAQASSQEGSPFFVPCSASRYRAGKVKGAAKLKVFRY